MRSYKNIKFNLPGFWPTLSFLAFFLLAGVVQDCQRPDEKQLGSKVLPNEDGLDVEGIDSTTIEVVSRKGDSINTDQPSLSLAGSYNDPLYGKVRTAFYTQVLLQASNIDLGDPANLELDSIVLSLKYNGIYGGEDRQAFQVFEMKEGLNRDSSYFSDDSVALLSDPLNMNNGQPIKPDLSEEVVVGDGDTLAPQLRLRLKDKLGNRLLDESGSGVFENNEAFLDFFPGFYVGVKGKDHVKGRGGVISFDLLDPDSRLTLYYRNTSSGDTTTLEMNIEADAARFTSIVTDHSEGAVGESFGDQAVGKEKAFLQAGGGTVVKLRFPHLMNYVDSGMVGVNKAELVLPVNKEESDFTLPPGAIHIPGDEYQGSLLPGKERAFFPVSRIFAVKRTPDGKVKFIPDQFEGDEHVGGFYDGSEKAYRINMTRQVQQVLSGDIPNKTIELKPGDASISVNRVVLNGPALDQRPMRLELTFTEL